MYMLTLTPHNPLVPLRQVPHANLLLLLLLLEGPPPPKAGRPPPPRCGHESCSSSSLVVHLSLLCVVLHVHRPT